VALGEALARPIYRLGGGGGDD
jgi:hypothetical protein